MEDVKKTIQLLNVQMANAAIEGDFEKALSCYTDDAISLPNYGEMLKV
jgi:ketosteroid isomerase-like protein